MCMLYKTPNLSFENTAQPTSALLLPYRDNLCCCLFGSGHALRSGCELQAQARHAGPSSLYMPQTPQLSRVSFTAYAYVPDPMGKKIMNKHITNLTRAIARRPGNRAHHDCTLHFYCCALGLFHGCIRMPSGNHGHLSLLCCASFVGVGIAARGHSHVPKGKM